MLTVVFFLFCCLLAHVKSNKKKPELAVESATDRQEQIFFLCLNLQSSEPCVLCLPRLTGPVVAGYTASKIIRRVGGD